VEPGFTAQFVGRPLLLILIAPAAQPGAFLSCAKDAAITKTGAPCVECTWFTKMFRCLTMQFVFDIVAFVPHLPFSVPKDIRRIKEIRYGYRDTASKVPFL
jgi:hypothetical protein